MTLANTDKQLTKVAGFLGLLQGTAWIVFSLICISLYLRETISFDETLHYTDYLNQLWYLLFLARDPVIHLDLTMTPHVFTGFVWVYLLLDLIWFYVSYLVFTLKDEKNITKKLTAWSHLTLTISVWDFITVVILGADYGKCCRSLISLSYFEMNAEEMCSNGIFPVLVIVARGFVLWIINVIFAVILHRMSKRYRRKTPTLRPLSNQYFQAPYAAVEGSGQYSPSAAVATPTFQNQNMTVVRQYTPPPPQLRSPQHQGRFEYPRVPNPDYHRPGPQMYAQNRY